jgi:transcriptional regulator with PAS, ATPase and Fis domain
LDEIGALPLSIQAKLLRVIQERETERLGSKKPLKLNFRLITATNVDLRKLAEEGKFRFDLFFRLSKAVLTIPPLRERPEDIPIYVFHFLKILNKSFGTQIKAISKEALDTFARYSWPGNVRELSNVLEQSFYNMGAADIITASHLPKQFENSIHSFRQLQETERPLREIVGDIERDNILTALKRFSGNKRETARHLGIQRSTLYLRLKKYGLK